MKIDRNTLEKIAHLARLEIRSDQEESLLADLNQILDWVAALEEIDTEGVEPLTHMSAEINRFREDEAQTGLDREKALELAPEKDDTYFRVPKVK